MTLDHLKCGEQDELSGAVCSLMAPHDLPHKDETDWGVQIQFREGAIPKLILPVPDLGTDFPEFTGFPIES